jgi:hypothetical protein
MKYRLASHPHQNKRSFPKKPASGGRPPRDKRYRAKERAKKDHYLHIVLVIYVLNTLVVPLTVLLIPVHNLCLTEPLISSTLLVIVPSILVACSKPFFF